MYTSPVAAGPRQYACALRRWVPQGLVTLFDTGEIEILGWWWGFGMAELKAVQKTCFGGSSQFCYSSCSTSFNCFFKKSCLLTKVTYPPPPHPGKAPSFTVTLVADPCGTSVLTAHAYFNVVYLENSMSSLDSMAGRYVTTIVCCMLLLHTATQKICVLIPPQNFNFLSIKKSYPSLWYPLPKCASVLAIPCLHLDSISIKKVQSLKQCKILMGPRCTYVHMRIQSAVITNRLLC